jgi:hypothetical protein
MAKMNLNYRSESGLSNKTKRTIRNLQPEAAGIIQSTGRATAQEKKFQSHIEHPSERGDQPNYVRFHTGLNIVARLFPTRLLNHRK